MIPFNELQSPDVAPASEMYSQNEDGRTRPGRTMGSGVQASVAKMNSFESLLLETLRYRLNVESAHLIYGVSVSMREISISVGPHPPLCAPLSPYDWEGACLPRCVLRQGRYITENIYFGALGSGSLLRLSHDKALGAGLDNVIVEHCKLHATLSGSFDDGIRQFELSSSEREVLYWGAHGLTAKETAKEMQANFRSVEYLLKTAKEKVGAQTLPEAIHKAVCTRQLGK